MKYSFFSKYQKLTVLIFILNFTVSLISRGQDSLNLKEYYVDQRDIVDVVRKALNKPPKEKPADGGSLILLPVIGYNPATGAVIGVGGQYAFKVPESSLYSVWMLSSQITTKGQLTFSLKNNIYTRKNRFLLSGDWRYMIYSQDTYGLGTNSPEGGILEYQYSIDGLATKTDSLAQPMKFNFARLYQSVSYKIRENLYFGAGYNFDSYSGIDDRKLRLTPGDSLVTSHYAYNTYYGFSARSYFSSALKLNIIYDTRDNMINSYRGMYAMVSWRGGLKILGNKYRSNLFQFEFRSFHSLSESNPRHMIAFWLMSNFSPAGQSPYMILPSTSDDQRLRSARGYVQGRFRGSNMFYGETEYRFPISKPGGILGGVAFVNLTSADNQFQDLKLFESVKAGYGVGLRIMADKRSRTNLSIDYGFGNKSSGFYLSASETF